MGAPALFAIVGALALAAASPGPRLNDPADLAEIERIERLVQPTLTMEPIIQYYADDAVTVDLWAPGVYRGRANLIAGFNAWLAPVAAMEMTTPELQIVSDGDLACSLMQLDFHTTLKNGQTIRMTVRTLDALRKIDGGWRIVQQHVALPLDPETGKAMPNAKAVPGPSLFAGGALAADEKPMDLDQARRALTQWAVAAASLTDPAKLQALYGPGQDAVALGPVYPGVARGAAAIAREVALANAANGQAADPDRRLETLTNGRFAVQLSTRRVNYRNGDGALRPVILRQSNCLRLVDGSWRSFFEERSYLVDQQSGRPEPAPVGGLDTTAAVPTWRGVPQRDQ